VCRSTCTSVYIVDVKSCIVRNQCVKLQVSLAVYFFFSGSAKVSNLQQLGVSAFVICIEHIEQRDEGTALIIEEATFSVPLQEV
jgi:hypothetical protein